MALKDKKAARKEAKQRAKAGNVLPDDDQKWEPPEAKKDKKAARKKAKPRAKAGNVLPDDDQKWEPPEAKKGKKAARKEAKPRAKAGNVLPVLAMCCRMMTRSGSLQTMRSFAA
jgi:hypothetical protein